MPGCLRAARARQAFLVCRRALSCSKVQQEGLDVGLPGRQAEQGYQMCHKPSAVGSGRHTSGGGVHAGGQSSAVSHNVEGHGCGVACWTSSPMTANATEQWPRLQNLKPFQAPPKRAEVAFLKHQSMRTQCAVTRRPQG